MTSMISKSIRRGEKNRVQRELDLLALMERDVFLSVSLTVGASNTNIRINFKTNTFLFVHSDINI